MCPETQTELIGEVLSLSKQICKVWKGRPLTHMHKHQGIKSQANVTPPKETNEALLTDPMTCQRIQNNPLEGVQ